MVRMEIHVDAIGRDLVATASALGDESLVETLRRLGRVDDPEAPEEPPAPGDDLSARITLRLPETLKGSLETAAAREGVSANAWIVRALARALEPRGARRSSNRLQGFARS